MSDLIERKSIRDLYSCLNPNDRVLVGQVLIDIDAIPSAEVPTTMTGVVDAIRNAEYRGYMKAVEERPKEEWTSVLAELHERFDALEKEIRKASAEMSAIIRANLDRPKGEWVWNENGMDWGIGCWCCSECGMRNPYIGSGDTALLSNPHNWAGSKYCPNCGARMKGANNEKR